MAKAVAVAVAMAVAVAVAAATTADRPATGGGDDVRQPRKRLRRLWLVQEAVAMAAASSSGGDEARGRERRGMLFLPGEGAGRRPHRKLLKVEMRKAKS